MGQGIGCRGICKLIEGLIVVQGHYNGRNNKGSYTAQLIAERAVRQCPRCEKWMDVDKLVGSKTGNGFRYFCPCCKNRTRARPRTRHSKELLINRFGMERKWIS